MVYSFANFRLDLRTRELRLRDEVVSLGPKPFDLLALLVSRRGTVVTKDDLYATLWPDTHVSEAALTSTVKLARRALRHGDVRESEGLGIKAVHGRGFRFVGDVRSGGSDAPSSMPDPLAVVSAEVDTGFVGRSAELRALHDALETASSREAQTALVVGEAGLGKTSLVDIFIETARAKNVRILRGQSVEHFGRAEPYLPVLEAWGRLATGPDADELLPQLRKVAPSWLVHLPKASATEAPEAPSTTGDRTAGRMLREMADALEMVSRSRPLILALEDVHWSDRATIDLITYLAQRRSRSHLLLIATYRPSEMSETGSTVLDLAREIGGRGHGVELRLAPLEHSESQAYLQHRLGDGDLAPELIQGLHERTDGHPLFLSNVVDVALRTGAITRENGNWALAEEALSLVPDDLRKIIDRQVESLDAEDRLLLEAASAAGAEFSVAALPRTNQTLEELEERCEALAWQERFIEDAGIDEWPDGTVAGRYRFLHTLYVDALYGRLASARRVRIHRAIGERLEQGFAGRSDAVCGELAVHFEIGRDIASSIAYRRRSAGIAAARHANREAMIHLNAAKALLPEIDEEERPRLELDLLLELIRSERSARIIDHSNLSRLYDSIDHALTLTRELGTDEEAVQLLVASATLLQMGGRTADAVRVATEALERGERAGSDVAITQAHAALGKTIQQAGWPLAAEQHHRKALALYDSATHDQHITEYGELDPGVSSCLWLANVLLSRGLADSARAALKEGVERASTLEHPLSLAWAHLMSAILFLSLSDPERARESLTLSEAISAREEFDSEIVLSGLADGWHRVVVGQATEAVPILEHALREYEATDAMSLIPICQAVLGTAYAFTGRPEDADRCFEDGLALVKRTEQPSMQANLLRTRTAAMRLLGRMSPEEVEEILLPTVADTRDRGDVWGTLNGAVQIARARLDRQDPEGARAILAPVVPEIVEGHGLPIVVEATGLLLQLEQDLDS